MVTEEWAEGYDASKAKQPRSANPYRTSTDAWLEWNAGYNAHQHHLKGE